MIYSGEKLSKITHSGWGDLENGFLWSISRYATFIVPIKKQTKHFGLQIIVEPNIYGNLLSDQYLELYCNGLFVLSHHSEAVKQEVLFVEIHPSIAAFGALKLDFCFPNAKSPKSLNISSDERSLGYKIFELQIID